MPLRPPTKAMAEKHYDSREEMERAINVYAARQGYGVVVQSSRKTKSKLLKVYYKCDRGGKYRNRHNLTEESRIRASSTSLVNCPFQIIGTEYDRGIWSFVVTRPSHNHDASPDPSAHTAHLKLTEAQEKVLEGMFESDTPVKNIQAQLRTMVGGLNIPRKKIYNLKQKWTLQKLGGRTPMDVLVDSFNKKGYEVKVKQDDNGEITHVFFAHPKSVELSRINYEVFILDATYKTTRSKFPLLHIVGTTSLHTTFSAAFVFMQTESESSYTTALQYFKDLFHENNLPFVFVTDRDLSLLAAVKVTFPSTQVLLCTWHIEKNVLKNCKPHFVGRPAEDWMKFLSDWTAVCVRYSFNVCVRYSFIKTPV